jgi:hypothetical protein
MGDNRPGPAHGRLLNRAHAERLAVGRYPTTKLYSDTPDPRLGVSVAGQSGACSDLARREATSPGQTAGAAATSAAPAAASDAAASATTASTASTASASAASNSTA